MDMGGSARRKGNPRIPDDLVMELLIRLPGKQVGRCKCVCKSWRSMIRSAHFKDAYGRRHRGLILTRFEPPPSHGIENNRFPFHVYYSTLGGDEFNPLCKFENPHISTTQIVNGILCVDHTRCGGSLRVYNVCTGEMMLIPRLPNPDEMRYRFRPEYHLGYDPAGRIYKLLRVTSGDYHIITLRPPSSSSSSTWEPISGPCPHRIFNYDVGNRDITWDRLMRLKMPPNDGFLCWYLPEDSLVLFDVSKEKFHKVNIPSRFGTNIKVSKGEGSVRAEFRQQRLTLSLWTVFSKRFGNRRWRVVHFVMDDDEGNRWSEHPIEFPPQLDLGKALLVVPHGNLSITSATELVVINTAENDVYCYGDTSKMEARLQLGKPPPHPLARVDPRRLPYYQLKVARYNPYSSSFACLYDANNLYLSLEDILSG